MIFSVIKKGVLCTPNKINYYPKPSQVPHSKF